jgi:endonuclease/exonuclease/phosphatase family metal-dependent hydrolase
MSEPLRLRVMTFNIHGGRPQTGRTNIAATAQVIREERPDLVGLQEVHRWLLPPPNAFEDQPGRLRSLLGMEVAFLPSLGFGPVGYGNVVLSRVRSHAVRRLALPGSGERRAVIEARFNLGGREVRLLNTHLALDAPSQRQQFEALNALIAADTGPLIAVGDWNVGPDAPPLQTFLERGLSHCAAPEILTFPCDNPTRRLDYIMVSPHLEVEACRTVSTLVSDHLPLVSDLVLR